MVSWWCFCCWEFSMLVRVKLARCRVSRWMLNVFNQHHSYRCCHCRRRRRRHPHHHHHHHQHIYSGHHVVSSYAVGLPLFSMLKYCKFTWCDYTTFHWVVMNFATSNECIEPCGHIMFCRHVTSSEMVIVWVGLICSGNIGNYHETQ